MENRKHLTKLQRELIISQIIKTANKHPEFKKIVETKIQENQTFLTDAHKKNSEAAMMQIEQWQQNPAPLNDILERQKKRDQQTKLQQLEMNLKAVPYPQWWKDAQEIKLSIEQQKPVTPEEAQDQFSRLRNEKNWKQEESNLQKNQTFLTEAHKQNSEAAMMHISDSKTRTIDWKMESERQKRNSKDNQMNLDAVPSPQWWENEQRAKAYMEQQKPVTPEEAHAQFSRLRNEKNWKQDE